MTNYKIPKPQLSGDGDLLKFKPKCSFKDCEAPAIIDGLCPFHYDLIYKHESRYLLKNIAFLLDRISHQLPLDTFQIIKPAVVPDECYFFNKIIPDKAPEDNKPPEFDCGCLFNPDFINYQYRHPLVIPPCQAPLKNNEAPVCIGYNCKFYLRTDDKPTVNPTINPTINPTT